VNTTKEVVNNNRGRAESCKREKKKTTQLPNLIETTKHVILQKGSIVSMVPKALTKRPKEQQRWQSISLNNSVQQTAAKHPSEK